MTSDDTSCARARGVRTAARTSASASENPVPLRESAMSVRGSFTEASSDVESTGRSTIGSVSCQSELPIRPRRPRHGSRGPEKLVRESTKKKGATRAFKLGRFGNWPLVDSYAVDPVYVLKIENTKAISKLAELT